METSLVQEFAERWIAAWNDRNLPEVLSHYAESIRFRSASAERFTGSPVVEGKDALQAYWAKALAAIPKLHFALDHAVWDPQRREMVIIYDRVLDGPPHRCSEFFLFDADGLVVESEAMTG